MHARARARSLVACALVAVALPSFARASAAEGRHVWVLARTAQGHCAARLRVQAGDRVVSVAVRGTRPRRYVTSLLAHRGESISTAQHRSARCRAIVVAKGVLPAPSRKEASLPAVAAPQATEGGPLAASQSLAAETPLAPAAPGGETPPLKGGVVLGTFDVVGAAQMEAWAAAGGTAVVVPVIWAEAQPNRGEAVTLQDAGNAGQDVLAEISEAHAAHLQVYLELDLQYPPEWVKQSVPQYVNQAGTAYSSTTPGKDIRDWVWSKVGREAVAGFVAGALGALSPALGDIAGVRVGGGMYGEMQYPYDGSMVAGQPSYWGYDAPAQTGVGLASGQRSSPLPGYVYGQGAPAEDAEWASWYLQSLGNFVHWYILQLRQDGWDGAVYVLHPSFGMREDFAPHSPAYEQQLALGTEYAAQMDAYDTLPDAWPWSTWADDPEPFYYPGDPVDSDKAAWRKLLVLAQERGLASHIMGENTGGGGVAAIDQMATGALRAGYRGVFYLAYPNLIANGGLLTDALVSAFDEQLSLAG